MGPTLMTELNISDHRLEMAWHFTQECRAISSLWSDTFRIEEFFHGICYDGTTRGRISLDRVHENSHISTSCRRLKVMLSVVSLYLCSCMEIVVIKSCGSLFQGMLSEAYVLFSEAFAILQQTCYPVVCPLGNSVVWCIIFFISFTSYWSIQCIGRLLIAISRHLYENHSAYILLILLAWS